MTDTIDTAMPNQTSDATHSEFEAPTSVIDGVALASRLLNDHPDDIEFAVRKICAYLHNFTASTTICRLLVQAALLDGTPLRARFVADLLSSNDRPELAAILVDHALSSAAKPWQKRRLRELKKEAASSPGTEAARREYDLNITNDGTTTLAEAGEATPDVPVDSWFSKLLDRLDASPPGLHHDVLRIRTTTSSDAREALRSVLATVVSLPVIPLVIADSYDCATAVCAEFDPGLLSRSRTVLLAPGRDGGHVIVTLGGGELLDAGPTDDLVLSGHSDQSGLAAAFGLVRLFESPTIATQQRALVDTFRVESSILLPLSSRTRAIRRVLRFTGTKRATAGLRKRLTEQLLAAGFADEALGLIESAHPSERSKAFESKRIRALFATGRFAELAHTSGVGGLSRGDRPLVAESIAATAMCAELNTVPSASTTPFTPVPRRVLTILHSSVPEQSGGYAVRAHSVLRTMIDGGLEVVALTRPGFPETANELAPGQTQDLLHGDVRYLRTGTSASREAGEFAYMRESIDHYVAAIRAQRPSIVHLRSTYVSALPGLIAARRLGLPVVYEVSGMWELVFEAANTARMEGRRARTVELENAVLAHADAVVTLTEAMREIIADRVRTVRPIEIMPNAVNTSEFAPRAKDAELLARLGWDASAPVIGYIGSLVGYEGLDVLLHAIAEVRRRGHEVRGLIVGDGSEASRLRHLSVELGLDESAIIFTGRVPHEQVRDFYSVIDVCAYPRLLTPATRAVSPLKPFEAMSARIPVLVSDVPALAEIAGHGERAHVVASGDAVALAEAIESVITDAEGTRAKIDAAATWTAEERSWSAVGRVMTSVVDGLSS